jgi:LuxR family maltose regulon positive regulatory protein
VGGDLRALALTDLGLAEAWTGRFDEANRHLDDGIALARQIGRPYLEVTGRAHLESWRSFRLGAERGLRAIELATEHGWADEPVADLSAVYLAT